MLDTLLESKSRSKQSHSGTILSVAAHTALIAAAVYATAQARITPSRPPTTVRAVYFPPAPHPIPMPQSSGTRVSPVIAKVPTFVPPVSVNLPVSIDVSSLASRRSDFPMAPGIGGVSAPLQGTGDSSAPFSADQVEKQVTLVPGALAPRYPEALRNAGVEGEVTAIFVVDGSGRAEDSVRFLHTGNVLFEDAVRTALKRMRFTPAEVGGRKVRQLVQMPFVFTLKK